MVNTVGSLFRAALCKAAVPLFFMVSGGLLLERQETISQLLKKRCRMGAGAAAVFRGGLSGMAPAWNRRGSGYRILFVACGGGDIRPLLASSITHLGILAPDFKTRCKGHAGQRLSVAAADPAAVLWCAGAGGGADALGHAKSLFCYRAPWGRQCMGYPLYGQPGGILSFDGVLFCPSVPLGSDRREAACDAGTACGGCAGGHDVAHMAGSAPAGGTGTGVFFLLPQRCG